MSQLRGVKDRKKHLAVITRDKISCAPVCNILRVQEGNKGCGVRNVARCWLSQTNCDKRTK